MKMENQNEIITLLIEAKFRLEDLTNLVVENDNSPDIIENFTDLKTIIDSICELIQR